MNNTIIPPEPPCKYPDIEHNFQFTGYVLASYPPQYPETCKNCGIIRIGSSTTIYRYTDDR